MISGGRRHRQDRGYLRLEGPSWLFTWREYREDVDGVFHGRRRSEVLGPRSWAKSKARKAADVILGPVNALNTRTSSSMTFAQFVAQKFEPQVTWKLKRGGQKHYSHLLSKHLLPAFGSTRLCDIGPDQVETLIADKYRAGYSPQTLRHLKHAVGRIFGHAEHIRAYVERNPAHGVQLPSLVHEKRSTYSLEQLALVLSRLKSPCYEMAILSAADSTGPAEMCGIRLKHANLTNAVVEREGEVLAPYSIAIRENFYEGRRGELKTGLRRRNIPLDAELARLLVVMVNSSKRQDLEAPLFQGRTGTPVNAHNVLRRIFRPLSKSLGFPVTWYGFRRAHSSLAAITGAGLDDRKLLMGHSNDRMTRYYDIPDMERLRSIPMRILAKIREQEKKVSKPQVISMISIPVAS